MTKLSKSFPDSDIAVEGVEISQTNWNFIKTISDRFPERQPSIYDRFIYMGMVKPSFRPRDALLITQFEPRQGLLQRNYRDVRSVFVHKRGMSQILGKIFRASVEMKSKYGGNHSRKILVHDIGEALTTDFTPLDMAQGKITSVEKTKLEDLAMKIIFAADPVRYKAYLDYEHRSELADFVIKAADYLEWWDDAIRIDPFPDLVKEIIGNAQNIDGPVLDILRDIAPIFFEQNKSPYKNEARDGIMSALNAG